MAKKPSENEMLKALHKADPSTLNKRYGPKELNAAYDKLMASKPGKQAAPPPPPPPELPAPGNAPTYDYPEKLPTVDVAMKAEEAAQDTNAAKNIQINNPNVEGPTGSTSTTVDPATGEVTQKRELTPDQQKILDLQEQLSQMGSQMAGKRLEGYSEDYAPTQMDRWSSGDLEADRKKVEDAVYAKLTQNVEKDYSQELEQKGQELINRGIPVGSDAYNNEMNRLQGRYDDIRENARAQAIRQGGQEYGLNVGLNEQMRANDYSQGWGTRNQNFGEISQLQNFGSGYMPPDWQQYSGYGYDVGSPTEYYAIQEQLRQNKKQLQTDAAYKKMLGRPSGGGGSTDSNPSPFSSGF